MQDADYYEGKERSGGGPDKSVDRLPNGIDERDFVGEKFHQIKNSGDGQDERVRKDLKLFGEMDDAKPLEKSESGNGGVDVEAGGEAGAEDEAESFERVHGCNENQFPRRE